LTRAFLLYLFGATIFCETSGKTVPLYLSALKNVDEIRTYDWGGAALERCTVVTWILFLATNSKVWVASGMHGR